MHGCFCQYPHRGTRTGWPRAWLLMSGSPSWHLHELASCMVASVSILIVALARAGRVHGCFCQYPHRGTCTSWPRAWLLLPVSSSWHLHELAACMVASVSILIVALARAGRVHGCFCQYPHRGTCTSWPHAWLLLSVSSSWHLHELATCMVASVSILIMALARAGSVHVRKPLYNY